MGKTLPAFLKPFKKMKTRKTIAAVMMLLLAVLLSSAAATSSNSQIKIGGKSYAIAHTPTTTTTNEYTYGGITYIYDDAKGGWYKKDGHSKVSDEGLVTALNGAKAKMGEENSLEFSSKYSTITNKKKKNDYVVYYSEGSYTIAGSGLKLTLEKKEGKIVIKKVVDGSIFSSTKKLTGDDEKKLEAKLGEGWETKLEESIEEMEKAQRKKEIKEFLAQGLNIPLGFGQALGSIGSLLGPDEWNDGWQGMFPDWFAAFYSIDSFINYALCEIPTKEGQATTTVFFNDGDIGAHIEGYKVLYDAKVACNGDGELCKKVFNRSDYRCHNDVCVDRKGQEQNLKTNIYRIPFMFDPSGQVVKKDRKSVV